MVRQILAFARGQEGERRTIELAPLLREVGKLAAHSFLRSVEVQVNAARDLWPVRGDVTQLYQALMNLVVNGRDAMPHGGTLTIAAENVPGDPSRVGANDSVCLKVRDTGTGIPAELRDRIFDPFFHTNGPG